MSIILSEQQKSYIKQWYGKCKTKDIAKELHLPLWRVYKAGTELNVNKKLNPEFEINAIQHQILLGGILGDGSFKRNGPNYYYRECHAIGEKQYLQWKFDHMKNMTTGQIHNLPSRNGHSPQVEFQTVNSPSLTAYVNLTKAEVITQLTELGYLIWMLDDGWVCNRHKSSAYICVAAGTLTDEELDLLILQGKQLCLDGHVIGIKQKAVAFLSSNNLRIKKIALQFFSPFTDIMIKKINLLKC